MLTPEQIEKRKDYICGSDVGIICGVNNWQTPVELWQIKTRRTIQEDISDKPAVKAGNMLEEAVTNWFTSETGKQVIRDDTFYVHRSISFFGGNIDGRVVGENAIFEAKTTQSDKEWGLGYTQGDNKIPHNYLCQVIHYCAITDCDVAYIAVLIRGIDFRWFKYERNLELENIVTELCVNWWNNHVVADVCPEPTTSDEVMIALQGKVSDEALYADDEVLTQIEALKNARIEIDTYEKIAEDLKNNICIYMNDKQTLLNPDGTTAVTWKLRSGTITFDTKKFKETHPEIYKQFEKQGKDVRTFLLKQSKQSKE